jgi:hypothetical protein
MRFVLFRLPRLRNPRIERFIAIDPLTKNEVVACVQAASW